MKKPIAVFAFFILFGFCIFGEEIASTEQSPKLQQELLNLLDKEIVDELIAKGKKTVYKYKLDNMQATMEPNLPLIKKMNYSVRNKNLEPIFLLESIYLFEKNTGNGNKNADNTDNANSVNIDKILKSISKLEGLEYYSHSRGKMRTLYAQSFAVEKIQNGKNEEVKKIADPIDMPTDGLKILACQEDLTFGKYIYSYEYFKEDGAVGTICTNTENLKYSIFKVISKEDMQVRLVVKELEDFVLVYCSTAAKFARLPGLEKKLKNSFSSRADAMYNWFLSEYKKNSN